MYREYRVQIAPFSSPNQEWRDWCITMARQSQVTLETSMPDFTHPMG